MPDQTPILIRRPGEVVSTITEARAAVDAGALDPPAPPGLAVVAHAQTGGLGRSARDWHSPPGGLWLTLAWRCHGRHAPPPERLRTAIAAAARAAAVRVLDDAGAPATPRFKAPNDLMVGDAKLAGCLVHVASRAGRAVVLLSLGMNVNNDPAPISRAAGRPIASLASLAGRPVDLDPLLADVLARLGRDLDVAAPR